MIVGGTGEECCVSPDSHPERSMERTREEGARVSLSLCAKNTFSPDSFKEAAQPPPLWGHLLQPPGDARSPVTVEAILPSLRLEDVVLGDQEAPIERSSVVCPRSRASLNTVPHSDSGSRPLQNSTQDSKAARHTGRLHACQPRLSTPHCP